MTLQRIQIIGFAPDMPSDTAGALITSDRVVSTSRGIKPGWSDPTTSRGSQGDLGTAGVTGSYQARVPGGSYYYNVGQAAKLWESTSGGTSVTDRSKVGGYNSTDTTDGLWSFAQFGVKTLAINKFDTLQVATTGSSAFADVSGAPKGSIVCTVGEPTAPFAMVFNYNDGTDTPDGIFWSALADYTDWTPDIATECGNISILEPTGPFTAAIKFRDGVVAFKESSMFLGTYVGPPTIWQWQRISSDIGCAGKYMVASAADVIYFADQHGIWRFDGSYPQLVPGPVQDYWARFIWASASNTDAAQRQMVWDPIAHNLFVWAGGAGGLVWNAISGMWLKCQELALNVLTLRPTAYVIGKDDSTSHLFVTTISENAATAGQAYIGYYGDPIRTQQITRVAPIWLNNTTFSNAPTGTKCDLRAWPSIPVDPGLGTPTGAQSSSDDIALDTNARYFDASVSGNYFSIRIKDMPQNSEFRDVVIDINPSGTS